MHDLTIRNMLPHELSIAIKWAEQEGWNPGLYDAQLFYLADPNGFFIAEYQGDTVAVGSAVKYNDEFAFCGLYIVAPEHRGKGFGLKLTQHRLAYCGDINIGIDGVLENVEIYKRIGYKPFYQNKRYSKPANYLPSLTTHSIFSCRDHIKKVIDYDNQCFVAKRDNFLNAWISQPESQAVCVIEKGQICGYAVRRKCIEGHKIGPLFADSKSVARTLLNFLQKDVEGETIILDVPENNPTAVELAEEFDMQIVFATSRMYQKGLPNIQHDKVFGITTFELG